MNKLHLIIRLIYHFKNKLVKQNLVLLLLFIAPHFLYAQTQKIISSVNAYRAKLPQEKVYLQTDKPYYAIGDTLWYKSYLLNADFLDASTRSGLLYVELCTDSGQVIKRQLLPVEGGISWGNIALDDILFKEGTYTLRAYTNWMQNFDGAYFFTKQIQLYNPVTRHWLVNNQSDVKKDTVFSRLRLTQANGEILPLRQLELKVFNGTKNIYQGKADTKLDGTLDVNFSIPVKPEKLTLQVKDMRPGEGNQHLDIPISLQRPEYTDLQFLPEGGNLVGELPAHIAFKAIGEDGKAAQVTGKIYNSDKQEVAAFKSTHLGMGSFELTPQAGQKYTAKIDGVVKNYVLPDVKITGTVMRVSDLPGQDSLKIELYSTRDLPDSAIYYLTGQSRNVVCFAAKISFRHSIALFNIPKAAFPTGIARFSLLNRQLQPLNERLVYLDHHDNLNINITPSRPGYRQYDSVALKIEVKDNMGKPVQGSFSLAVTDDAQVKADTTASILTNILLTGELKGEVENPAYYFNGAGQAVKDLDNLLLTQGWTGYDWKDVFNLNPLPPAFAAQPVYAINGQVTNFLNKPVAKTRVTLFSKKPFIAIDTITNEAGRFTFKNINPVDTAIFFIQARNKAGNSMNVGITVDEFKPPVFKPLSTSITPWYVNTDTTQLAYAKTTLNKNRELDKLNTNGKLLKEVKISAKKVIEGSHNLNGPGEADQVIDKEELEKAGKVSLGDLLKQRIKGFGQGNFPKHTLINSYMVLDKQVHLVFDGIDVDFFISNETSRYYYYHDLFAYFTAEDIKGIEVLSFHNLKYFNKFIIPTNPYAVPWDYIFIEITTRSGHGPFMQATPGKYLYKPLAYNLPKQFYRPRYLFKPTNSNQDLRSTIHWEPNIVTDTNGKGIVSFYSAGHSGTYTIIIQGSNMNGNVGAALSKINIQ